MKNSKTERLRRLAAEGSWIVFGQAASVVGALVGVRLLTELLDPTAYGELGLGMTVAALINQVILGPLSNGASRFYSSATEQGDVRGFLIGVRKLLFRSLGGISFIYIIALGGLLMTDRVGLINVTVAVVIFALVSGCNSILSGIQNAARQRAIVAVHQAAEIWARFIFAAIFIQTFHSTSATAVWGYVSGSILIFFSQYRYYLRSTSIIPSVVKKTDWQKTIWDYSWPFGAWGVFTGIQMASDRWALGQLTTAQEVGFYVVLYQLGYAPISMATGMALQFLAPIIYARAGDAGDIQRNAIVKNITWRLTILAIGLTCVASLVAFVLHQKIFNLLVASEYSVVSDLLPWMIFSGGIFAAGQTIALNLMSLKKTQAMVRVKIFTAILGVVLNIFGAYWYGTTGVVFAGVAFSVSYLGWIMILQYNFSKNLQIKS